MVPETLTVAPLNARIEPPSATDTQSEKVEPSMVATAPAPETWRGPAAEASPEQATATCRIVTPVQPEAASHKILLLVLRRIVLDADTLPAIVREHGKYAEEHKSTVSPEGKSASPVSWMMSPSYTRVNHIGEKPDAGQART